MSEAKPTPGPWKVSQNVSRHVIGPEGGVVASAELSWTQEVSEANARLIADAGTVFHTTGLTPSQLVERVKELEEAAKLVLDWYEAENDHSKTDFYQRVQMCRDSEDAIRAALSKARPNTAEGE